MALNNNKPSYSDLDSTKKYGMTDFIETVDLMFPWEDTKIP